MLKLAIVRIVDLSTRYPWWVIVVALTLSLASAVYVERHFAIKTDINELISPDLPWATRVAQFVKEFPQREILVAINAPTPERVEQAASKLRQALETRPDLFVEVRQPQSGSFFKRNGLLYLSVDEVKRATDQLIRADALIGTLAADPSLRGTLDALSLALVGIQRKELTLDELTRPLVMAADTAEAVLASQSAQFSWQILANGNPPQAWDLLRFIEVQPVSVLFPKIPSGGPGSNMGFPNDFRISWQSFT